MMKKQIIKHGVYEYNKDHDNEKCPECEAPFKCYETKNRIKLHKHTLSIDKMFKVLIYTCSCGCEWKYEI